MQKRENRLIEESQEKFREEKAETEEKNLSDKLTPKYTEA